MNDERPEPDRPDQPDPREQLAGLVAPLAQLGLGTVQDIAAVVRSTRTAGRDVWRLVNVFGRVRHVDWEAVGRPQPAALEATPAAVAEPVEAPSPATPKAPSAPNLFGPFGRVADAALRPATAFGAAVVSPVRRAVADTIGLSDDVIGDCVEDLREIAGELIEQSLDPDAVFVRHHPAFARILSELTPDEARILRFLAVAGPQPSIDIRTKSPFQIGSERIAYGINMIAEMAGCGSTEFSENYLVNLNRLGLIVFSKEPVEDYRRYSLLEVQPVAMEAIDHADLPTISIYRSIHLSAFGRQFCEVCIDLDGYNAGGWAVNERGDKIIRVFGRRRKEA